MIVPAEFLASLSALPDGYVEGSANDRRYGVTLTRSPDGRRQWLYAGQLGGEDRISFNIYLLGNGPALRPCEMPVEKVISFVASFRPDPAKFGRTAAAPARSSNCTTDGRTHA